MESAAGVQGSVTQSTIQWNFEAMKEPRGFIKLIEFIIAIFAFATTTSSKSSSSFSYDCNGTETPKENTLKWSYPFRLDQETITLNYCNGTTGTATPFGDYGPSSQFYVFVGVMAFLYCIGAVFLYVCFDDKYRKFDKIPIVDFIVSCVFALLWLISSSAWASGVTNLKKYTDPEEWYYDIVSGCTTDTCTVQDTGNFASLNVSLIFGFLNMCVWGGNLWFLYKETRWFKVTTEHPETSPSETPQQI